MDVGGGEIAARGVIALNSVMADAAAQTLELVSGGVVVIDAGRQSWHLAHEDVAFDGVPGASRGRRFEGQPPGFGVHPLLHPHRKRQQCRQFLDGDIFRPRETAPRPPRQKNVGKLAPGRWWKRNLRPRRDSASSLAASPRDRPAAATASPPRAATRTGRPWLRCGKTPPRDSSCRGRASPERGRPQADPTVRAGLARRDVPGDAAMARTAGQGPPQSDRGAAIPGSNRGACRDRWREGRVARSRSCTRPGGLDANRERGGGPAGTG